MKRPFLSLSLFGAILLAFLVITISQRGVVSPRRAIPCSEIPRKAGRPEKSAAGTSAVLSGQTGVSPRVSEDTSSPEAVAPWFATLIWFQQKRELFGSRGEKNFQELTDFVASLPTDDLPAAAEEIQKRQAQNPTPTGLELLRRVVLRWAESDLLTASDWIIRVPVGPERQQSLAIAASRWATRDLTEAVAWIEQLRDEADRTRALVSAAAQVAYDYPRESLTLAASLPAGTPRDEIIKRAAAAWARSAPAEAMSWVSQIEPGDLRQQIISELAIVGGEVDPVAAGNLAVSSIPAGLVKDRTIVAIVQRWVQTNPQAARQWVMRFPEGNLRRQALTTLDEDAARRRFFSPLKN